MNASGKILFSGAVLASIGFMGVNLTGHGQTFSYSVSTVTNPAPSVTANFGAQLATLGTDRFLAGAIGAQSGTGTAYLLDTNGTLLATFANPTATFNLFGGSVTAVGTEYVIIGAPRDNAVGTQSGAAYVFDTNGTWLTTLTRPEPANFVQLGNAAAAVGNDRVLLGAYFDDIGAMTAGAAYLFHVDGTWLTTFTNPTPAPGSEEFGYAVATLGAGRVIISAPGHGTGIGSSTTNIGAAYLFSTNSTLLATFNNPTPASGDNFGAAMAGLGNDRIVIGANFDDRNFSDSGAAYLFDTNGALLTTFTNPTPASGDQFGAAVAAVGNHHILIGVYQDDVGAGNAGVAHLFSTNGALLLTYTNPSPAGNDLFGYPVTASGNRMLIGAYQDDTGASNAGAAYVFTFNLPPMNITGAGTNYSVTWSTPEPGLILQQADSLSNPAVWTNVPGVPANFGPTNVFDLTVPSSLTNRFYRLRRP